MQTSGRERGLIEVAIWTIHQATGSSRVRLDDGYFSLRNQRIFFLTVQPAEAMGDIDRVRSLVYDLDRVLEDRSPPA